MPCSVKLIVCAAAILLTGCDILPKTTSAFRAYAPSSFMFKKEVYTVDRPALAVATVWASRSVACLNYGSETIITGLGGNSAPAIFRDSWRTHMETEENRSTLVLEHYSPNEVGAKGWYVFIVADVEPFENGSRITVQSPLGTGEFT